jgi:pyruvate/2-oxoglutarate dehydrogenase complex dihydrolipoamide acyltransferase (E2) component
MPTWFITAMLLPWPQSRLVKALLGMLRRQNPAMNAAMGGTVGITAVGMFGEGLSGWGMGELSSYSLGLLVGSIAWKPAVIEGRIEPRQILNLTVVFDHDVIVGAPAARFTRRLVELIENGYGLEQILPTELHAESLRKSIFSEAAVNLEKR